MKRIVSLLLCILLLAAFPCMVLAEDPMPGPIVDNADLLTTQEEDSLDTLSWQIYYDYGIFTAIVTVDSLGDKSAQAYADDFYDNNYYRGSEDGVLLLIAMDTREWAISTCGEAIYALTDYGLEQIFQVMAGYLSDDEFYPAFRVYLEALPAYFDAYKNGSPIDGVPDSEYAGPGYLAPSDRNDVVYYPDRNDKPGAETYFRIILISLVIGVLVGGGVLLFLRSRMNTAKAQSNATGYMVHGSYHLHNSRDMFLYSRVSRVRRSENNGGGSHRSGGSSVHHSSGGHSHGGRSGRF